jgi:hypothetical protein
LVLYLRTAQEKKTDTLPQANNLTRSLPLAVISVQQKSLIKIAEIVDAASRCVVVLCPTQPQKITRKQSSLMASDSIQLKKLAATSELTRLSTTLEKLMDTRLRYVFKKTLCRPIGQRVPQSR